MSNNCKYVGHKEHVPELRNTYKERKSFDFIRVKCSKAFRVSEYKQECSSEARPFEMNPHTLAHRAALCLDSSESCSS